MKLDLFKILCMAIVSTIFSVPASPCLAFRFVLPESAYQGETVVGRVVPPFTVTVSGKSYAVSPKGYFVIGVPRQQKTDFLVLARYGNEKASKIIRILAYPWQVQRVDGLPKRYVKPPPEALKRITDDTEVIRVTRRSESHKVPLFIER